MNFRSNPLPSSKKEIEWYWNRCVREHLDFSKTTINNAKVNFSQPADFFDLKDQTADKISFIGREFDFFAHPIALKEFELRIIGEINADTQIGGLLSSVNRLRAESSSYGIYATFVYIDNAVYCAFTICLVDKDTGMEMETAVVEISQDEVPYVQPIFIGEISLDYYSFDEIAKISYWLGNFWVGIQYEMNNRPEEIRVIEQRALITGNGDEHKKDNHIVLVRRIVPVDEDGYIVKYGATGSGRQYRNPAWGVRGHERILPDGRVTYVNPYRKGKARKYPDALIEKEYRLIDEKIDSDID